MFVLAPVVFLSLGPGLALQPVSRGEVWPPDQQAWQGRGPDKRVGGRSPSPLPPPPPQMVSTGGGRSLRHETVKECVKECVSLQQLQIANPKCFFGGVLPPRAPLAKWGGASAPGMMPTPPPHRGQTGPRTRTQKTQAHCLTSIGMHGWLYRAGRRRCRIR